MPCPPDVFQDSQPAYRFGGAVGVQVWVAPGDRRVQATLLIDRDQRTPPIVFLNQRAVGTEDEGRALTWALAQIAERDAGFFVLRAD